MNAVDKHNQPLAPKQFPGIPSKEKFARFISLLLTVDEVKSLRGSIHDLSKIRVCKPKRASGTAAEAAATKGHDGVKYLDPSIINQYLYKSFQLDSKLYSENLMLLDQLSEKDSVWAVKNTEAVAFINSMLIKFNYDSNNSINFDQFISKLQYWMHKANLKVENSILFNSSAIIAAVYSRSLDADSVYLKNLDSLTAEKVYSIRPHATYLQYDHAYSIISALKDAAAVANNEKLSQLVARWDTFLLDVEKLKGDASSSYENFLASPVKLEPQGEAEAAPEADPEAAPEANAEK